MISLAPVLLIKGMGKQGHHTPSFVPYFAEGPFPDFEERKSFITINNNTNFFQCSLKLGKCNFSGCEALGHTISSNSGGALYLEITDSLLQDCNFSRNRAFFGGSLMLLHSTCYIGSTNFINDTALKIGGSIYETLHLTEKNYFSDKISSSFVDCTFTKCSSDVSIGAASFSFIDDLIFKNCLFTECFARQCGGALGIMQSTSCILECRFFNNYVRNHAKLRNFSKPFKYDPKTSQLCFGGGAVSVRSIDLNTINADLYHDLEPPAMQLIVDGTCFYDNSNDEFYGNDSHDMVIRGNAIVIFNNSTTNKDISKSINIEDNNNFHGPNTYIDTSHLVKSNTCFNQELDQIKPQPSHEFSSPESIKFDSSEIKFPETNTFQTLTPQRTNPYTESIPTPSNNGDTPPTRVTIDFSKEKSIVQFTPIMPFVTASQTPFRTQSNSLSRSLTQSRRPDPTASRSPIPTRSLKDNEVFVTTVSVSEIAIVSNSYSMTEYLSRSQLTVEQTFSTVLNSETIIYSSSVATYDDESDEIIVSQSVLRSSSVSFFVSETNSYVETVDYSYITIPVISYTKSEFWIYSMVSETAEGGTTMSAGLIIGLATGGCAILLILAMLFVWLVRNARKDNDYSLDDSESFDAVEDDSSDTNIILSIATKTNMLLSEEAFTSQLRSGRVQEFISSIDTDGEVINTCIANDNIGSDDSSNHAPRALGIEIDDDWLD